MKRLLLAWMFVGLLYSPALAQNSCDDMCNKKCANQGSGFTTCYESCKRTCVPNATGNRGKDKTNICENRCSGKGASFQACYDSCMKN